MIFLGHAGFSEQASSLLGTANSFSPYLTVTVYYRHVSCGELVLGLQVLPRFACVLLVGCQEIKDTSASKGRPWPHSCMPGLSWRAIQIGESWRSGFWAGQGDPDERRGTRDQDWDDESALAPCGGHHCLWRSTDARMTCNAGRGDQRSPWPRIPPFCQGWLQPFYGKAEEQSKLMSCPHLYHPPHAPAGPERGLVAA